MAVLFLAVFMSFVTAASAQASVHSTIGTVDFGDSGTPCAIQLEYDGDLPGTGTISSATLPNRCNFYGSAVELPDIYLEAEFDSSGSVELDGELTVSYGLGGGWLCTYSTTQTGSWNPGSPTAFLTEAELVRQSFSPLCNIPAMNYMVLTGIFTS